MNNKEKNYISECFSDAYKNIGLTMQYVVLNKNTVNLFNEKVKEYDELNKITVYGFYSKLENFDQTFDSKSNGRIDGKVTFVIKPLLEKGIVPKYGDAIDIPNELGNLERHIVIGFVEKNDYSDILARLYVTRELEII